MTIQYIEIKNLVKSSLNVRKTGSASADEELKASILAHGLMQNLVVTDAGEGKFQVIAGGRRLEALHALQAEGLLPDDHAVQCQIVTEEHATEMSLAENVVRQAMHPADQFEAFAALIDQGLTAEQVATRFGINEKLVEQRMKLARVAPELLAEYRAEKLTLNALMAFTVTDDHRRQVKVYKAIKDGWQRDNPRQIRSLLTEQLVEGKSKLATFVGLEAYEMAGGTVRRDLFGEDVYLENPELLHALVNEKLKLIEQELLAEGWNWVIVAPERDWTIISGCSRIEPQPLDVPQELLDQKAAIEAEIEAIDQEWNAADFDDDELLDSIQKKDDQARERLEELEEQIEALSAFDPEEMKTAGCHAYISYGGKLEIEKGLVQGKDRQHAHRSEAGRIGDDERPEPKDKGLSEALKRDLAAYRLGAAQAEIAKHPAIAFDLLVFDAAMKVLADRPIFDGPNIAFQREHGGTAGEDARGFISDRMEALRSTLHLKWLDAKGEAERFTSFQRLEDHEKHAILSFCVAATLQPKLDSGSDPTAYDLALAQTGANVADYWRPTKENFLGRVTKDQLLAIGKELSGGENGERWARNNVNQKKGDIAGELHRVFNTPDLGGMTQEQLDRVKNWLPKGMAFRALPEAIATNSTTGKEAA